MSDDNTIVFALNPKPQAAWSLGPDFSIRFVVGRKKPNLIARLWQRWFFGIYWRAAFMADNDLIQKGHLDLIRRGDALKVAEAECVGIQRSSGVVTTVSYLGNGVSWMKKRGCSVVLSTLI